MNTLYIKLGLIEGHLGGTIVGLAEGETYVAAVGQEDMIFDGK